MNILYVIFLALAFDVTSIQACRELNKISLTSIQACRQLNKISLDNEMPNIDLNHSTLKQKFPDEYRSLNILSKHIIAED